MVCGVPTSFTPLREIEMLASTKRLVAGPLSPNKPSVVRVSASPPIETWTVAFALKTPALELPIVSMQVAVLPPLPSVGPPQVDVCVPGAGETDAVIAGKVTGVALPGRAVGTIVNMWG